MRLSLLFPALLGLSALCPAEIQPSPTVDKLPFLHTEGNRLLDSNRNTVILRGVNCASLEWSSDGEKGQILETVGRAVKDWHCNVVRVPVSQDRWFGLGPEQKDKGMAYRNLVHEVVDKVVALGSYVLFDLHWSDAGVWGSFIGQHDMPDKNSVTFWNNAAIDYRNNPGVIFDLYNEPHDVSWDIWLKGGKISERGFNRNPPRTFEAVGMQELLDTVRRTGANNLCVAGGLDWSYDYSGILKGHRLLDPDGQGVLYPNHVYNNKGQTVATWKHNIEAAAKELPIIVSEFGNTWRKPGDPGEKWMKEVMAEMQSHHFSWLAWDLHPAAGPTLIKDWTYTPTLFGALVKPILGQGHRISEN